MKFEPFPKITRLSRECVITEKLDGTNAQVVVLENGDVLAGSRTRYISVGEDNHGFAKWVEGNKKELRKLGAGRHFGEWWGQGIQRGYGLKEKRFSLFNTARWSDTEVRPKCCHIVPVIGSGIFTEINFKMIMEVLAAGGSLASPGFMKPEGIVIYHKAGNLLFKKTLEKDDEPKTLIK